MPKPSSLALLLKRKENAPKNLLEPRKILGKGGKNAKDSMGNRKKSKENPQKQGLVRV